jgi:TRAP-type C4-dicarboxylate transport system permease small subunit
MKHVARRILGNFEEDAAAVLMAAILAVLGLQVFTRYVLGNPLSWTEEVARHLFIWMVFFGASAAIRDGTHVSIDLLVSRLPKGLHAAVTAVNALLILFFLGNVLYWGIKAVDRMWSLPTATLEIPIGLVYVVLPISAVLMMIRTVVRLRVDLRGGQVVRTVTID